MGSGRTAYGSGTVLLAFLMGGLVGAGFGLLFAPRTGEETRDRIKEQAEKARGRMRETARTARGRGEELSATGREKYAVVREKVLGFTDRMIEKIFPAGEENNV